MGGEPGEKSSLALRNLSNTINSSMMSPKIETNLDQVSEMTFENFANDEPSNKDKLSNESENYHHCNLCDFTTNKKDFYIVHMKKEHKNNRTYMCTECDYKTNIGTNLTNHINGIHMKTKDFRCLSCEYASTTKGNLVRHMKMIHGKHEGIH